MKSTVPCGTGATIQRVFAEQGKDGLALRVLPEFLKEGSAIKDFLHPDRVVVGDDGDWAGDAVVELYAPLHAPFVRTDIASAEMVKLASNAFLATKISFINEIANVCGRPAPTWSRSRAAWASTTASGRSSCRRGSASAAAAFLRTHVMYDEFKEQRFASPPLLKRLVMAGWYGRKSGKGFYDYSDPNNPRVNKL